MSGFIGARAKKRRRNFFLFFFIAIMSLLFYYTIPFLKLNETLPSDTLLPSEEELSYDDPSSVIQDLGLKIFDKEQKIIFRDRQINKLKDKIKKVNQLNLELKDNLNLNSNKENKNDNFDKKIKKIKKNNESQVTKLNEIIKSINYKNSDFLKKNDSIKKQNEILKKEYEDLLSKNLKLNISKDNLENKVIELEIIILEKSNIIKLLKDNSHHN